MPIGGCFAAGKGWIQPVVYCLPGLADPAKREAMKALLTALIFGLSTPLTAMATNPLTRAEQPVCRSVKQCADIVSRHRLDEFDYRVLAAEFDRFGNKSVSALAGIASAETQPQLSALVKEMDVQTAINLVIRIAKSNTPEDRSLAASLLSSIHIEDATDVNIASSASPTLERLALEHPSKDLVGLITRLPFETARPSLEQLLGSGDLQTVSAAYQHLYDASRKQANEALNQQMLKTEDLSVALAIGQMMAWRDNNRKNDFYAKWLDALANNTAYPEAMRDGARAGSFLLFRRDAPFTPGPDLTRQLLRLPDGTLDKTIVYWVYNRTEGAVLPAWQTVMETKPALRSKILIALRVGKASGDTTDPFISIGLSNPKRARTVMDAIRLIPDHKAVAWSKQLNALAETHPFDSVRYLARLKLAPPMKNDPNIIRIGGVPDDVITARTRDLYCTRGDWIDPAEAADQLFIIDSDFAALPYGYAASRRGLQTAYPARKRWIAGFDRGEFGGSLLGFDYATGNANLLLDNNTQLVTPVTPVRLGHHPDALWVFSGLSHLTLNRSQVMTLAPDDDNDPVFVWELPNPLQRAYRLGDGSLMLQFHDEDTPFQAELRDKVRYRGWTDVHPPLRLTPQGELLAACPMKTEL